MTEKTDIKSIDLTTTPLAVLPLRDVVVFPHTVLPLFVGRPGSIKAIEQADKGHKHIFLATQKEAKVDKPSIDDVYEIGTVATVLQIFKAPDGNMKVLIEGMRRAKIKNLVESKEKVDFLSVYVEEQPLSVVKADIELEATKRLVLDSVALYVKLNKKMPEDIVSTLESIDDYARFSDVVISTLNLKLLEKQNLLEQSDVSARLTQIIEFIQQEMELINVEKKIHGRVRKQMESNQREYYLNEQIKSIQKELGSLDSENELENYKKRIKQAKMSAEATKKANAEVKKLQQMSQQSSDASIARTYIEHLCELPWYQKTRINKDLKQAQVTLDTDHYGLEKVKERIVEYLAVQNRVSNNKANILCLVGPPGVGKTSMGQSIARAVNRKFARMALGGVRDEAEIRGHRRTYIGALPGTIIQKMQKVKVKNPLFLLDEVDKVSSDYRGDTASALLEVLDPEQNHTFNDHYIEVDYDLSQVMFVVTANTLDFPPALLDRMEVIQLEGYTEEEKLAIAKEHLLAKQFSNNGVKKSEIRFTDAAILAIVRYYTREAGVRNLSREIAKICRKVVKAFLLKEVTGQQMIDVDNLAHYLGVKKYRFGLAEERNRVGEVTGLAWTQVGGDLLTIEAVANKGKGKLIYTGHLGDVMKESIRAAMSVVRARASSLNIADDFHETMDIHIHLPDGATPKDGPSAGAAICTALVSILSNRKVKANVAMTGEITLRGEITPIGGLKEKLLAALRGGINTVLIPAENERELSEIPKHIKDKLTIKKVRWIDEVLSLALEN